MLMCAVKLKRVRCTEYLVTKCGGDPNAKSTRFQTTSLILAAYYGCVPIVKLLLASGADRRLTNKCVGLLVLHCRALFFGDGVLLVLRCPSRDFVCRASESRRWVALREVDAAVLFKQAG